MMMMVMMISRSIIMMAVVSFTCPCHLYGNTLSIEERMPATSRSRLRWRLGLEPQKPQALNPHKPPQKKTCPPPPQAQGEAQKDPKPSQPPRKPPHQKKKEKLSLRAWIPVHLLPAASDHLGSLALLAVCLHLVHLLQGSKGLRAEGFWGLGFWDFGFKGSGFRGFWDGSESWVLGFGV